MRVGKGNVESYSESVRTLPNGRIQKTTIITSRAPQRDTPNIIRPRTINGGRVGKRPSLDIYERYEDMDIDQDEVLLRLRRSSF